MMWSSKERQYPLLALAFNHRAEAFYRADCELGETNCQVAAVREKGLRRISRFAPWHQRENLQETDPADESVSWWQRRFIC